VMKEDAHSSRSRIDDERRHRRLNVTSEAQQCS
jgi:hypothetical protein